MEEINLTEEQRIVDEVLRMKALDLHVSNFKVIRDYLHVPVSPEDDQLSKWMFTYADSNYAKAKNGGITPRSIKSLPAKNGHAKFFRQELDVQPRKLTLTEPLHVSTPKLIEVQITNQHPKSELTVHDVLSSTPEVSVVAENATLPVKLQPKEVLKIKLVIVPFNLGEFDPLIYILTQQRILVYPLIGGQVQPSRFGVSPILYDQVHCEEELSHSLQIANPHHKQIFVEEFYLTSNKFKAEFKKVAPTAKPSKPQLNFIIEPNSNRTFCKITYKAEETPVIEETFIVIRFSTGEFLRIPMIVRTVNDLLSLQPRLADFGLIQLHQKPMKMQLSAKVHTRKVKAILDYYLPLDQPNLDFKMKEPPKDLEGLRKSRDGQRQKPHAVNDDSPYVSVPIGTVYLNPLEPRFIATSIKVKIQTVEDFHVDEAEAGDGDKTKGEYYMFVEIPIIGSVVNHTKLFSAIEFTPEQNRNQSLPLPLVILDSSDHVRVPVEHAKLPMKVMSQLLVKNNLSRKITVSKIIDPSQTLSSLHPLPEYQFMSFEQPSSMSKLLIKSSRVQ